MRLVHRGNGKVVEVAERPFIDTTEAVPRAPQAKRIPDFSPRRRFPPVRAVVPALTSTRYAPGALADIPEDGCRFTIADRVMCGAKAVEGTAWCACHRQRVYEKRATQ